MKRIKSACLEQTIHFLLNENLSHEAAVNEIKSEFEQYKARLDRNHTKYKIVEKNSQPDGSIIVKIKKQCNKQNCDEYLA